MQQQKLINRTICDVYRIKSIYEQLIELAGERGEGVDESRQRLKEALEQVRRNVNEIENTRANSIFSMNMLDKQAQKTLLATLSKQFDVVVPDQLEQVVKKIDPNSQTTQNTAKVTLNHGIQIELKHEKGRVCEYDVKSQYEGHNYRILSNLLVDYLEKQIEQDPSASSFITKAWQWIEKRRDMHKAKCKICGFHLNFRSGCPTLPMVQISAHELCHLECWNS